MISRHADVESCGLQYFVSSLARPGVEVIVECVGPEDDVSTGVRHTMSPGPLLESIGSKPGYRTLRRQMQCPTKNLLETWRTVEKIHHPRSNRCEGRPSIDHSKC